MNNPASTCQPTWQTSASLSAIKSRAQTYDVIRAFFARRQVLEVETPLLSPASATDPHLASIPVQLNQSPGEQSQRYYLHTSPEFPMKRLLACGLGAIYQICKTFRNTETGLRHNPEFTMLEWYRPGFELDDLITEVSDLVAQVLSEYSCAFQRLSYREAFLKYLHIDPFTVSEQSLIALAKEKAGFILSDDDQSTATRDDYLNVLLSMCIEPHLGVQEGERISAVFLYAYPSSQASLAKIRQDEFGQDVAERFELYINGLELANGYFELTDAVEQKLRFEQDNMQRKQMDLPEIPIDTNLLMALESGLPSCSGVALGLDRLLMVKRQATSIEEVISFPITRA